MNAEFAKDLINAQSEITTLPKDKKGYGYNYTAGVSGGSSKKAADRDGRQGKEADGAAGPDYDRRGRDP